MASVLLYVAIALAGVVYYFYKKLNRKYMYFKNKGIPQLQTETFYGNGKGLVQGKTSQGDFYEDIYKKLRRMGVKHGGIYIGSNRVWIPVNPELIKTIITKDFPHFSAHYPTYGKSIMLHNVFLMDGEEWRDMRRKLTPTFTSGKMKMMSNIMFEKSIGLSDLVGKLSKTGEPLEMIPVLARFTTDIIGSCAFGIECNSIEDENSEFFRQGQNIFQNAKGKEFSILGNILEYVGLSRTKPHDFSPIENFFRDVVRDTIDYREQNKILRKDFLHLMIQLKNKGAITELTNENEDIYNKTVDKEVISLDEITGQCLLFFNAGFETSSTTMGFALLELTQNQDVQQKLRDEVREVLKRHNGKFSYEAIQEMTYCESIVYETLRRFPAVPYLPRICTKTYTIPGTDSVIEKGTTVVIPVSGLHMDPEYFPNPEKFIPDRFSAENKGKIKDFTYLPFGEGPRMCLGLRFGVMQSKAGLASLIKDYNFTLNKKTSYPPKLENNIKLISAVENGIWLNATKVN